MSPRGCRHSARSTLLPACTAGVGSVGAPRGPAPALEAAGRRQGPERHRSPGGCTPPSTSGPPTPSSLQVEGTVTPTLQRHPSGTPGRSGPEVDTMSDFLLPREDLAWKGRQRLRARRALWAQMPGCSGQLGAGKGVLRCWTARPAHEVPLDARSDVETLDSPRRPQGRWPPAECPANRTAVPGRGRDRAPGQCAGG